MSKDSCHQSQAFSLEFYAYRYFIILFLFGFFLIVCSLFFVHWSPKYPVIAKLDNEPHLVSIRAPQAGFIKLLRICHATRVEQGHALFRVDKLHQRLFNDFYSEKRQGIETNLTKLHKEIDYQHLRLQRLKLVLAHQAITEDYYHQQFASLEQLKREYKQSQDQLIKLKHEQSSVVQAPISGYLKHLNVKNHSFVSKDAQVLVIEPFHTRWIVRIDVPVAYKLFLQANTVFNFCLPSHSKIKRYSLKAKFLELSPKIKHHHQESFLNVKANLINANAYQSNFITGMPLQGYLIGESRPLIWWIWHFISA